MICRHCQKVRSNRPRGLCWSCYYRPGVREMYPSTSKYARRGVSDFNGQSAVAAMPTQALPGTEEKVEILAERARLGLSLWHPRDARIDAA
jgi:limonene-1,2-epoxide hydrolase